MAPPLFTRPFVLAVLATTALFLTLYLPLPVLPPYAEALGASKTAVGVAIGVFQVAAMVLRLLTGRRMDRSGRKALLLAGLAVFALTAVAYGHTGSFADFLALRVLQGLGWGVGMTGVAAIVADLAPPERRGEAIAYWGLAPTMAMALGPWAGGQLLAAFGAASVFHLAGALGLAGCAMLSAVPDARPTASPPDAPLLAFPRGARLPATTLLLSSLSYGALIAFLPVELAAARAGTFFSVYAVAVLVARTAAGRLSDRLGRPAIIYPGLALGGLGILLTAFAAHPVALPAAALLYGAGIGGASFPGLMALTVDRCPAASRTAGLAVFLAAYDVAIASGSALLGPVYEAAGFLAMNAVASAATGLALGLLWLGLRGEARADA